MQFSLTLHYILDKRLIHVLSKNRMYDLACFTSSKNVEKAVMHYSRKSMKKNYLWFNSENTSIAL